MDGLPCSLIVCVCYTIYVSLTVSLSHCVSLTLCVSLTVCLSHCVCHSLSFSLILSLTVYLSQPISIQVFLTKWSRCGFRAPSHGWKRTREKQWKRTAVPNLWVDGSRRSFRSYCRRKCAGMMAAVAIILRCISCCYDSSGSYGSDSNHSSSSVAAITRVTAESAAVTVLVLPGSDGCRCKCPRRHATGECIWRSS